MKLSSEDQKYWKILRKKTENERDETDNAQRQKITAPSMQQRANPERSHTQRELWEGEGGLQAMPHD